MPNKVVLFLAQLGTLSDGAMMEYIRKPCGTYLFSLIVQELCESQGGRPGLSVLTSHLVSVDVN